MLSKGIKKHISNPAIGLLPFILFVVLHAVGVLEQYALLDDGSQKIIALAQQRLNLSARAYHRVIRVARTIADLAQSEQIQSMHLTEALSYRSQEN